MHTYSVSIDEQRDYLASIPPLDRVGKIALDVCSKYRAQDRMHDCARMLGPIAEGKADDHLKQIAVKWIKDARR